MRETFGKHERWTLSEFTCTCAIRELPVREKYIHFIYKTVYNPSKGSVLAGKSERIKTHRLSTTTEHDTESNAIPPWA
ncbi:hypothetical protein M9H77_25794 [Catharanthus roseus]|uniref:Uncharacterized protein n=1 Tax=Catharanthus roseus TaxID=4058 RepID=A0ACC0ABX5_CATRO|nr:hypothetical protein M9H77_25794 [Catharanthus roseus]